MKIKMINPYHSVCALYVQVWIVGSLPFKTSAGMLMLKVSDSKKSDLVLEDIGSDVILTCVTEYPVCLQKWGLKISRGQILSAVLTDCCRFSDQMQQRLH